MARPPVGSSRRCRYPPDTAGRRAPSRSAWRTRRQRQSMSCRTPPGTTRDLTARGGDRGVARVSGDIGVGAARDGRRPKLNRGVGEALVRLDLTIRERERGALRPRAVQAHHARRVGRHERADGDDDERHRDHQLDQHRAGFVAAERPECVARTHSLTIGTGGFRLKCHFIPPASGANCWVRRVPTRPSAVDPAAPGVLGGGFGTSVCSGFRR